jgi:hypothetical protein
LFLFKENQPASSNQKQNRIEMDDEDGEEEEDDGEEDDDDEKDIKLVKVELKHEVEEERRKNKDLVMRKQHKRNEVKREDEEESVEIKIIEIIENPLRSREEILKKKLAKANDKVYKWMTGIGPNEIEETIGDWDKLSLLKMVEMADQEIRQHPEKFI